ncbi:hypothetical protein BDV93DRAFT_552908 [Ceratobasidium sp. AG-I]|nr:hypothetical protein BDV93DRAFT_552908 [Ceratobasidium sp. AG-I]
MKIVMTGGCPVIVQEISPSGHEMQDLSPEQATSDSHISLKHENVTVDNNSKSTFFALVIGINNYPELRPLAGAVADANEISNFLTTDLKVPANHIINLRDESASREAIIQALRSLKEDSRVHEGDPILIFYAGHGGWTEATDEWKARYATDEIQAIFPYDYKAEVPGSKKVVNCIPDRTIGVLLNELAAAKGNNITVIFDSCYSASCNRSEDETDGTDRLARSADVDINIPADIDADILSLGCDREFNLEHNGSRGPEPLLCTNQSSHIFLAASGSNEKAWEEKNVHEGRKRGVFTVALLKAIRGSGVDKITYQNLMRTLPPLPKQSPHCYGVHQSRILFNSRVPSRKVTFIPVKLERNALILNAGASSGVTLGSVWELHASATEESPTLGYLNAHTPNITRTALLSGDDEAHTRIVSAAKTNVGLLLFARQVRSGPGNELRVYFSPEARRLVFPNYDARCDVTSGINGDCEVGYVVHPSRDSADMAVELYNPFSIPRSEQSPSSNGSGAEPEVEFFLCHPQVEKYNVSQMRHRKPARYEEVEPVLFAAARWNCYLRCTKESEGSTSTVSMEMMNLRVGNKYINDSMEELWVDLNKTGVVDFVAREEDEYGLRLSSRESVPLYTQVFYFDATDFSISKLSGYSYSSKKQDPEVPAHGQFTVGDNGKGGSPIQFRVRPGAAVEVGFMKLFWSTDPLELDRLQQDSVFEDKSLSPVDESRGADMILHSYQSHQMPELTARYATLDSRIPLKHESVMIDNNSDSNLFALIVGINKYSKILPLTGAVADANALADFLATDIKVPLSHIINLRDESASREAIIQALSSLKVDPRIRKGDPILIFYAGHGGLKEASDEWKARYATDEIQAIFPCDYKTEVPGSKEVVNCIPDRTILALLNELAAAKGDNITVIFDSCHFASSSRCGDEKDGTGRLARSADVDIDIPLDIDAAILSSNNGHRLDLERKYSCHPEPLLCTNQSSHVHFTACGSDEKAWEEQGRGVFTVALLKTIRANRIDKISYRNLVTTLPVLPKQSPHCYGVHKSRVLFNSRVPSRKATFVPVTFGRGILTLNAGASSGVTLGSIWELHTSATEDSPTLGRLKAQTPSVSYSILVSEADEMPAQILNAANTNGDWRLYARQVQSGTGNELRVYFTAEAKQLVFPDSGANPDATSVIGEGHHEVGYVVHPSRDSADLAVEVYNPYSAPGPKQPTAIDGSDAVPEVVFVLCHPLAEKYEISRMRHRKPARREDVEPVLFAAARWNWYLKRTNDSGRSSSTVSMEVMKLCEVYGDYVVPVEGPLENLNKTGVVEFLVREEDRYGLRLSSEAPVPLYIRVFYFDMMDLSISTIFGHHHSNYKLNPEIPACGQFIVGDDQQGGSSIRFSVMPDMALEVGFMKLFWSTDPLELDDLGQDSVFELCDSINESRAGVLETPSRVMDWGTALVTLVMRS